MPIDNEIRLIYKELNENPDVSIEEFYRELSEMLDIAPLHLHSILSLHHTFLIDETLKRKGKNGQ